MAVGAAGLAITPSLLNAADLENESKLKGNINHSVCYWTYNFLPLEEFCQVIKNKAFCYWLAGTERLANYSKVWSHLLHVLYQWKISLTDGWNNKSFHPELIKNFTEAIPLVAAAGYKNLICFSGNKKVWIMKLA